MEGVVWFLITVVIGALVGCFFVVATEIYLMESGIKNPNLKGVTKLKIVIAAVIAAILFLVIGTTIGTYNTAVQYEETIIAAHDNSKNILGQHAPKIKEAVGVTKLAPEALVQVFNAANGSRYGEKGSQAVVQWIKEQNPNLDQQNYAKIIEMIEAGRNDFMNAQTVKIDKVRQYREFSRGFFTQFILGWMDMPKSATDEEGKSVNFFDFYGKIVVSSHASGSFKTGLDDGVEIK